MLLPSDVTSSGSVTAARAAFELQVTRVMDRAVARFVRDVYDDATAAWDSPTVLAAASPDPFTLGQLLARWAPVVDALSGNLARAAGAAASSAFMGRVQRRLRDSALPLSVYEATKRVLTEALADPSGRPNRTQLKAALRRELVPRGDSPWRAQGERIARTETTAVFNLAVEDKLREDGIGYKRWVAHHDAKTRHSHSVASGQTVPTDQPFIVGGWSMMGPGDPAAPDSETANCRCTISGVRQ